MHTCVIRLSERAFITTSGPMPFTSPMLIPILTLPSCYVLMVNVEVTALFGVLCPEIFSGVFSVMRERYSVICRKNSNMSRTPVPVPFFPL